MVATSLVGPDIEGGAHLIEALERGGLPIAIAAWLRPAGSDWQLFIASPDVQTYGPTTINKFIDAIRNAIDSTVSFDAIYATNTTNHFVNDVSNYFVQLKSGGERFRGQSLGDVEIDGGFVYKIDRKVLPSRSSPRANSEVVRRAKALAA